MNGRYGVNARWYDLVSLERPVYRAPRLAGVDALDLRPTDRVLVLGVGTGFDLPPLLAVLGPGGSVVGVDASAQMLARAGAKVADPRVQLLAGDAGAVASLVVGPVDAVLASYALSVMTPWRAAWAQAWQLLRPGGRAAVVDLALPDRRWLRPAARVACLAGGADPERHPWRLLESGGTDVSSRRFVDGHVVVTAATKPPRTGATR